MAPPAHDQDSGLATNDKQSTEQSEQIVQNPTQELDHELNDRLAGTTIRDSAEKSTEDIAGGTAKKPAEELTEEPAEEHTEKPADEPTEKAPAEEPTEKSSTETTSPKSTVDLSRFRGLPPEIKLEIFRHRVQLMGPIKEDTHPSHVERLVTRLWRCDVETRQLAHEAYYKYNEVYLPMKPDLTYHHCAGPPCGTQNRPHSVWLKMPRAEVGHWVHRLSFKIFVDNKLSLSKFRTSTHFNHVIERWNEPVVNQWRLLLKPAKDDSDLPPFDMTRWQSRFPKLQHFTITVQFMEGEGACFSKYKRVSAAAVINQEWNGATTSFRQGEKPRNRLVKIEGLECGNWAGNRQSGAWSLGQCFFNCGETLGREIDRIIG